MPWKYNPFTGKLDYYEAAGIPAAHHTTHEEGGTDVVKIPRKFAYFSG